jgi:hypothetical protein
MLFSGIGTYTSILTISTLIGFVALINNRIKGLNIMLFVSIGWLLRYFEHAAFLILYDKENIGRWVLVTIPILLATIVYILAYRARQENNQKAINFNFPALTVLVIAAIGLISFVRKPHVDEFNCWYYFDNKNDYRITFAVTPDHIWEGTSNSNELRNFILKNGIRDDFREGIYCPETKVKIVTRFKKIVAIRITGFHNTSTNVFANLKSPIDVDISRIKGDLNLLQPEFNLGD